MDFSKVFRNLIKTDTRFRCCEVSNATSKVRGCIMAYFRCSIYYRTLNVWNLATICMIFGFFHITGSALAADPCQAFKAAGVDCKSTKLTLFMRMDGRSRYFRSTPSVIAADRQTFACCIGGEPNLSLFLVLASDFQLVGGDAMGDLESAMACGIPVVPGLAEIRGYLANKESASGLLSLIGSKKPDPPTLVEVRGRLDLPSKGQLGGGLCNMAGDTSLWTEPKPSAALNGKVTFDGWTTVGDVHLVQLQASEEEK